MKMKTPMNASKSKVVLHEGSPKGMKKPEIVHPHQNASFAGASNEAFSNPKHRPFNNAPKMRNLVDEHPVAKHAHAVATKLNIHKGPDVGPFENEGMAKMQNPRKLNDK